MMMDSFPSNEGDWNRLVDARTSQLREFLKWAEYREREGPSMRLAQRGDLGQAREMIGHFPEAWWAVVVHTCFDSVIGTLAVAEHFQKPMNSAKAHRVLEDITLPRGSVKGHRTQPTNKGAKIALVSACERAEEFRQVLFEGSGFDDRYRRIRRLRAPQWGRTTCFDLLIRTGILAVSGQRYEPEFAYLSGSTGPSKGFQKVWGIEVTPRNAHACEAVLRGWTDRWHQIAEQVGVGWPGEPYTPADFENALCIFQESRRVS